MATKRKLANSSSEEEQIQAGIDQDSDSLEWTEEVFKKARPAKEVLPQVVSAYNKGVLKGRTRGPQKEPIKEPISIRIDQEVIKYYRKKGRGWQAQMNEDLRKAAGLENKH